jgi:hypothetical protein
MSRSSASAPRPIEKETVMKELREVLLGNACQIILSGVDDTLAETYLGISLADYSLGSMHGGMTEDIEAIDLNRFSIACQLGAAYDFAVQQGDIKARMAFTEDDWNDLSIFLEGAARCSFGGESTPLFDENSTLRRTLDMALARMNLRHGYYLTIRQLSLLADIGETAVRTALSADGIRTEGKPAQISAEVADPWLRRRRGYVPTMEAEEVASANNGISVEELFKSGPFESALVATMDLRGMTASELAQHANIDEAWFQSLMATGPIACDLDALRSLADGLDVAVPLFAGRAVEAILARK